MHVLAKGRRSQAERVVEDRLELGFGERDAHARLQPCECIHDCTRHRFALCPFVQRLRYNQIGRLERGHLKVLRQDSDHTNLLPVDVDQPVYDACIAGVVPSPQTVRDERHPGTVWTILFRQKIAAQQRHDPHGWQKALLHTYTGKPRRTVLGQVARIHSGL